MIRANGEDAAEAGAGGGGGASGDNGGDVTAAPDNTLGAGDDGTAGDSFEVLEDPTALF